MLHYEVRGHYAVITIDRPESRNAIDPETARLIEESVDAFEADPKVWIAIVTGVPPVFCAGADLKALQAGRAEGIITKRGGFAGLTRRERATPLIAAVDGPALAGGTELVLACDLIVASRTATFGIPEVKRSMVAGAGGVFRLGRKIPVNVAMECALTGDPISAERAHGFGLVNELCDAGDALTRAIALADRVCANSPLAVLESRRIVLEATMAPDELGWRMSREALARLQQSEDYAEGLAAFVEKRRPAWKGR